MPLSRRSFIRDLGLGGLATVGVGQRNLCLASVLQSEKISESGDTIRLDQNENPYGPTEAVLRAVADALEGINRSAVAANEALIQTIARTHNVRPAQVILGSGSREILRAAAETFLGRGKKLLMALPSFPVMTDYAKATKAEVMAIPLSRLFEHNLDALLAHVDSSTTLIYICNPNNPTATLTPRKAIDKFLAELPSHTYVVIDEAYHHFAEPSANYVSFLDEPSENPRLIVTRSFSKIFGLAGLRVGYGIASPAVNERIAGRLMSGNVNVLAARAAGVALLDSEGLRAAIKRNTDDRQEFYNEATGRGLKPLPSHANFVTMDTTVAAPHVIEHFSQHNILIGGPFPNLDQYVRVSLGKPDEMLEFWRVWDLLDIHPMMHH